MTLRIERAKSDSPRLPLTLAGVLICGALGYQGAKSVPWPREMESGAGLMGTLEPATTPPAPETPDAGRAVVPAVVDTTPRAPVRVNAGALQGCGDGEETDLAPSSCDAPAAVEAALRTRLTEVLSRCPSAMEAARDPSRMLSIGLRVDRPRRRLAVLLGRSSSVADRLSYVACVREQMGPMEALWALPAAHPRYLYYFVARFGPLGPSDVVAPAPTTPTAAPTTPTAAPTTPTAAPTTPTAAPTTPTAAPTGLPTTQDLQRMRSLGPATVTWSVAIIRDAPRTGAIVGRLVQGTEVEIVDHRGGWYAIRWGRSGTNVGWTFRTAIGQ
ncbi:MAG: SH3 domain-containing protein [Myxococcaceae bacterium]|nr:MAG: SH3 domain-containing protein [Myxococcaceae bacterium]